MNSPRSSRLGSILPSRWRSREFASPDRNAVVAGWLPWAASCSTRLGSSCQVGPIRLLSFRSGLMGSFGLGQPGVLGLVWPELLGGPWVRFVAAGPGRWVALKIGCDTSAITQSRTRPFSWGGVTNLLVMTVRLAGPIQAGPGFVWPNPGGRAVARRSARRSRLPLCGPRPGR